MQPEKVPRTESDLYLIGEMHHQIIDDKLPSNRQILSALFFNTRKLNYNFKVSSKLVLKEIEVFWEKANIVPTSDPIYCET